MEPVYVGWLSLMPSIIAIVLALITKEVLFSLTCWLTRSPLMP